MSAHKETKMTFIGTLIWIILAMFFTYEFLLRTIIGTFEHQIQVGLGISLVLFAILSSSAYQLSYGLMQIPVGFIVSRFGLKKSAFVAMLFCAVSVILFAVALSFTDALIYRILMGIGSSFGFICLLVAVYEWMPRQHFALFIGLSQFLGTLGPMMAGGPLGAVSQAGVSYHKVFVIVGIIGLVIAALILLLVRNNDSPVENEVRFLEKKEPILKSLKKIFTMKEMWCIAIYSALVYFSIEYLAENSTPAFLHLSGYTAVFAGYMITLSWLGYAIGCPLLGFISDRIKRRKSVMIAASLFAVIGLFMIFYMTQFGFCVIAGFFLLGMGASGQSLGFAAIAEQSQKQYVAAGMGFNNAMIMTCVAIIGPMIGYILMLVSGGKSHGFTLDDFHTAFAFILGIAVIGLLLAIFGIKETYCKPQKEAQIVIPKS